MLLASLCLMMAIVRGATPAVELTVSDRSGFAMQGSVTVVDTALGVTGPWLLINNDPGEQSESYVISEDSSAARVNGDLTLDVLFGLRSIGERYSDYNGTPRIVAKPGADVFYKAAYYIQVESHGEKGNLLNCGFYNGKDWDEVRMGDEFGETGVEVGRFYRVVWQYAAACSSLTLWVFRYPEEAPFFAQRIWGVGTPRPSPTPVHIGYGGPGSRDAWFDGYLGYVRIRHSLDVRDFPSKIELKPRPRRHLPLLSEAVDAATVVLSWPDTVAKSYQVWRQDSPEMDWLLVDHIEDSKWTDTASTAASSHRVIPIEPFDSLLIESREQRPPRIVPEVLLTQAFQNSSVLSISDGSAAHLLGLTGSSRAGPWSNAVRSGPTEWLTIPFSHDQRPLFVAVRAVGHDGSLGPLSKVVKVPDSLPATSCSWASIPVQIAIFRHAPTDTIPREEVDRLRRGIELAREFYWRNSGCRLNLQLHYLMVEKPLWLTDFANDGMLWPDFVEPVLKRSGFMHDEVGLVFAHFPPLFGGGNFGGMTIFQDLGYSLVTYPPRTGVVYPGSDPDINYAITWLFCHELQHSVDLVAYERSGQEAMWHGDKPLDCAGREGQEFSYQAGILRAFDHYADLKKPWGYVLESVDGDGDGIPDSDPRVPMDEETFGSSPTQKDSDSDGLTDLEELMAGIYTSADPRRTDSDADGLPDGNDPLPLIPLNLHIPRYSPEVDGSLEGEWPLQTEAISWSARDGFSAALHLAWESNGLAIGVKISEPTEVVVELDCAFDGWWHGRDNVFLVWHPDADTLSVRVMDATPEARDFRQEEIGYRLEVWDTSETYQEKFGRLLEPSRMIHASSGTREGAELELVVPRESRIAMEPMPGDTVGLRIYFPQIPATVLEQYQFGAFVMRGE